MNAAMLHNVPSRMMSCAWRVVVVGAGGTGSAVLPSLARLHHAMLELGHPGGIECTVYDDDRVSPTNVGRQGFYPNDVGEYKAALIVNRINMLMGTDWEARTSRVNSGSNLHAADLVIGCVDTRAARRAILQSLTYGRGYYLDCGNDSDSGQVIIGQAPAVGPERLPHVGDLFPELVDPRGDAIDETPSCSMADALRKQSLVINQAIAVQAFNLLWTMFRTGRVPFSGVFVNLSTGRTGPIPLDPSAWARFGYEVPKPVKKKAPRSRKTSAGV